MGTDAGFRDLTPWAADFLRAEPWLVQAFVYWWASGSVIDPVPSPRSPEERAAIQVRHAGRPPLGDRVIREIALTRPADVERVRGELPRLKGEWNRPWLDLGKSWRVIVLDDVADAASRAILGGNALGPDVAFEPARLLDMADVRARAAELAELLDRWPTDTMRAQVRSEFEALVAYYSDAAREGRAMLAWRH